MNHVITKPGPRDMGFGCSCGKRYPTQKEADKHAEDQNLTEENTAKAEAAEIEEAAERVAPTEPDARADAPETPTEAPQAAVAAPSAPQT